MKTHLLQVIKKSSTFTEVKLINYASTFKFTNSDSLERRD